MKRAVILLALCMSAWAVIDPVLGPILIPVPPPPGPVMPPKDDVPLPLPLPFPMPLPHPGFDWKAEIERLKRELAAATLRCKDGEALLAAARAEIADLKAKLHELGLLVGKHQALLDGALGRELALKAELQKLADALARCKRKPPALVIGSSADP